MTRTRVVLYVLLAVVLLGVVIYADRHKASRRTLHVVNGYDRPLQVEIPGLARREIPPRGRTEVEIPEGDYTAKVGGPVSGEIPLSIRSTLILRLFDDRVFVLNPGGAAILIQEEEIYGTKESKSQVNTAATPWQPLYGRPFLVLDGIHYPFREFPKEIKISSKKDVVRKRRIFLFEDSPSDLIEAMLDDDHGDEALAFGEWALKTFPGDSEALYSYASLGDDDAHRGRVRNTLRVRALSRPIDVPAHRAYQGLFGDEERPALVAEYDAWLTAEPDLSELHYLRGLLSPGLNDSSVHFDRALRLDPKNGPAHQSTIYTHCSRGDWASARASLEKALAAGVERSLLEDVRREILLAQGEYEALEAELREAAAKAPKAYGIRFRLAQTLAARGNREAALQCADGLQPAGAARLKASALYALGDFAAVEAMTAQDESLKDSRAEALLALGKVEEAEKLMPAEGRDAFDLLTLSMAWSLAGDAPKAAGYRKEAAAKLSRSQPEISAAGAMLEAGSPPSLDAALDLDAPARNKAILLTALAQAFPGVPALRERAAALNIHRTAPYPLIRNVLASIEKRPR